MSLKEKALSGVLWSTINTWGHRVVSFIVFLILARLLTPDAFGLVALAAVYISFVNLFVDQGFSDAIVQREDLEDLHLDTAFWTNLVIGSGMCAVSFVTADLIAVLFGELDLGPIIRWLSIAFILKALVGVQTALFNRNLEFRVLTIRSLIAVIAGGITGVTMAFADYGVWSLVGQQLTSSTVGAIVLWKASNWSPSWEVSKDHFLDLFSFGISSVFDKAINIFNLKADDFIIGLVLGSTALGYYTIAFRILQVLMLLISSVITRVVFPTLSKLQSDLARLRSVFYKLTEYSAYLVFPVFIGLSITASQSIPVIFGSKWGESITVMQALALAGITHCLLIYVDKVLYAIGKPNWNVIVTATNALVYTSAIYIAARWGIGAVGITYALVGYITMPIPLYLVKKAASINIVKYLKIMIVPFVSSTLMGAIVFGVQAAWLDSVEPTILLSCQVLIGIVAYVSIVWALRPSIISDALRLGRDVFAVSRG